MGGGSFVIQYKINAGSIVQITVAKVTVTSQASDLIRLYLIFIHDPNHWPWGQLVA